MTHQPFDLTGKAALITGGNSGIGLGMAEAFAAARASVAIWGTSEKKNRAALASDASTYHTGDTFVIDGGYIVF